MTIDDFIRFFSGGNTGNTPEVNSGYDAMGNFTGMAPGILSQQPAPTTPVRQPARVANTAPALLPLQQVEIPSQPPIASVMAQEPAAAPVMSPSAASMAPDNRDVGGGQNFALKGPQQPATPIQAASGQGNGVLNYLDNAFGYSQPDFLGRLGGALAVAGSQDPTKALMMLQQNRAEEAKLAEARRKANEPKFTPLKDGAFMMVEAPGMAPQVLPLEAVQKYSKEISEAKSLSDLQRQIAVARESVQGKTQFETFKSLNEAAGGSGASATYRPEVKTQIGYANAAIDFLKNGGDNINLGIAEINSPVAKDLFDRTLGKAFGSDSAAARRQIDFLLGTEVLSDVGQMKGALSDADRKYLQSIRPKSDDPTELKINYLTELQARLDRREQSRIEAAMKRDQMLAGGAVTDPATGAAPASPAATPNANAIQTQAAASFGAYEPNKYEYRVGPNGNLQRRLKGQ